MIAAHAAEHRGGVGMSAVGAIAPMVSEEIPIGA